MNKNLLINQTIILIGHIICEIVEKSLFGGQI